jgi:alkanesulfonate monooxygenase SsuD/methylene tetrahydromethanopterin reductase-like flavin-dependent oxidoreductase (luciferase family)
MWRHDWHETDAHLNSIKHSHAGPGIGQNATGRSTAPWDLKHDPVILAPMLTDATSHIGIIATRSTSFYPPWLLARRFNRLDHLSGGRIGWNMVTSSEDRAAQNDGPD